MGNDNNSEPDFIGALQAEFGIEPEPKTPEAPTPAPAPAAPEEKPPVVTEPQVPPKEGEKPTEGEPAKVQGEEDKKIETPEEIAQRQAEEAAKLEAPKPLTADEIKAAVRDANNEITTETTARVEKLHAARTQIIETLYPEGIDKNIYDTNGKVVKTAQDIVDRGLINERTGEPYTYEEAASFVLEANRKMDANIEELNQWADNIAEKNISLIDSNTRVMSKWGDILKSMPDLAKQLAETYISTQLQFDKTGSYITNMSMTPEQFYDLTMAPYKRLGEALTAKQALEAAEAERIAAEQEKQQQDEQAERNGLPPQRGTSKTKANSGDPMLDALLDELNS